ncbi:MAG: prepilin-type N-terminal cleavage/methylation domain-containing protein [Desulfobulbaceae bacterium]|nr:prepilin-type N-terminal cleavage/methylation domain-containing protein [Desulfobulbaceae bacterium]
MALLGDGRGITLLELLVAMMIMALISTMLYSVLNVGVTFSRKGEMRARQLGRDRALLELLHRQVQGAWYDRLQKKVLISTSANELKLVTTAPLLHRDLGVVLAIYLYDPAADILYYTEKKDFYNPSYQDNFQADKREMLALVKDVGELQLDYKTDLGELNVTYRGRSYDLPVRCWNQEGG